MSRDTDDKMWMKLVDLLVNVNRYKMGLLAPIHYAQKKEEKILLVHNIRNKHPNTRLNYVNTMLRETKLGFQTASVTNSRRSSDVSKIHQGTNVRKWICERVIFQVTAASNKTERCIKQWATVARHK